MAIGNDGIMTVEKCREVNGACSANLHSRITDLKIDLALIKKHLGINGQYVVEPFHNRRAEDDPGASHEHIREQDVVINRTPTPGNISFPPIPRWMILGAVCLMLLAGAGLLLIIQTKTDLDQIKKFQTLTMPK